MSVRRQQKGGVLVEFGLVALVLYLFLAATLTFGSMLHTAQVAQDVARLAARELALTPLPATMEFEEALSATSDRIFDADRLVVDLGQLESAGQTLDDYFAASPIVNRALRPVFIFEQVSGRRLFRFPGALLQSANPTTLNAGFTVGVPLVVSRGDEGAETIRWVPVVEELRTVPADPSTGPFSLASSATDRGVVALRVNIPDQSAVISSFEAPTEFPPRPNGLTVHTANEGAVQVLNDPATGTLSNSLPLPESCPIYSGPYGLGQQQAFGRVVRPYRRVFSGQALFRREVFQ